VPLKKITAWVYLEVIFYPEVIILSCILIIQKEMITWINQKYVYVAKTRNLDIHLYVNILIFAIDFATFARKYKLKVKLLYV
jgi:hypothetical protein